MRHAVLFFAIIFLIHQDSYNQENKFFDYPSKKYNYSDDTIAFNDFYLRISIMTPYNKKKDKDLWIERVNGEIRQFYETKDSMFVSEPQYVGSVDNNGTIYIPKIQLINDLLIFVFDGLNTKQVILCKRYERRVLLGNRFAITKDSLFLYSRSEESEFIYRYNVRLDKIVKIRELPKNLDLIYYEFKPEDKF